MAKKQPEKPEETLLDMCKKLGSHPELLQDPEAVRIMLDNRVRNEVLRVFGYTLEKNFEEAMRYLKSILKPCSEVYREVDLRRIIGTEIAWQNHTAKEKYNEKYFTTESMDRARREFVSEARDGIDPVLDEDSPTRRMTELTNYVRSWRDFPAFGFGIKPLEDATGGILPGEILILTGAPGTMKTSLALSAVDDFVSRTDSGLAYYCSVDMAPREITERIMERESGIPQVVLKAMSNRDDPELTQIREAISDKYDRRLAIKGHTETKQMILGDLLEICLKRQPQLVVIDYFTRLKQSGQSDLEFVEDAMPKILRFAHQYQASFLILSQMSRASRSEQATGRVGGHGKGGGIVEELAHTEIELFQQPIEGDKPQVIAAVTKARRGISGQFFSLEYDGPIKRFTGKATKMSKTTQKKTMFEPMNDNYFAS